MSNEVRSAIYSSLMAFVISQNSKYKIGAHHRNIANVLDDVSSGKIKRLIINMPPRFGKSLLVNQYFPAYYLGKFPDREIITTTYSQDKANDFGRAIRNQISSPEYKSVFPNVKLAVDSQAASKFSLVQGGNLFAVGVNGPLTGRGASLIIMDDVTKGAVDASSETMRNSLRVWYQSVLRTRLTNNGAIILVMTRWSMDDIAGWLIDEQPDEWTILSYPALDDNNKSTWEDGFSTETLINTRKEIGTKVFNCLYQQKPEPIEDALIRREWIQYHKKIQSEFKQFTISWDTSFTNSKSSDFTVGVVIGKIFGDPKFYIVEVIRDKMDFNQARKKMVEISRKYKNSSTIIELSANGHALFQSLQTEIIGLIPNRVTDGKVSRVMAIAPIFELLNICFPMIDQAPMIDKCIEELIYFPRGKHDDFCDALSQGIIYLKEIQRKFPYAELGQFETDAEWELNQEKIWEKENEDFLKKPEFEQLFPEWLGR